MGTDVAPALSRADLLARIADEVAAGLPTPSRLTFMDRRWLDVAFDSTAELDQWLSVVWGRTDMRVGVTTDADGRPTSWQYRPADLSIDWCGWFVYPLVFHEIDPDLFTETALAGER